MTIERDNLKMKKPFEVGDKVRVYGWIQSSRKPFTGVVAEVTDETLTVTGNKGWIWAHPKQCRRIIKRKRREIWIAEFIHGGEKAHSIHYEFSKDSALKVWGHKEGFSRVVRFIEAND